MQLREPVVTGAPCQCVRADGEVELPGLRIDLINEIVPEPLVPEIIVQTSIAAVFEDHHEFVYRVITID